MKETVRELNAVRYQAIIAQKYLRYPLCKLSRLDCIMVPRLYTPFLTVQSMATICIYYLCAHIKRRTSKQAQQKNCKHLFTVHFRWLLMCCCCCTFIISICISICSHFLRQLFRVLIYLARRFVAARSPTWSSQFEGQCPPSS